MRDTLPKILCGVCGVLMLIQFFVPHPFVQQTLLEWVNNSLIIVGCFGLTIGLASLIESHGMRIQRRMPGWGYSVITLATAAIVAIIGLVPAGVHVPIEQRDHAVVASGATTRIDRIEYTLFGYQPEKSNIVAAVADTPRAPVQRDSKPLFDWVYNYMLTPLSATTFSLLGFYMMTAAYRAMRIKSWEAALLLSAAVIVLLGQIPLPDIPLPFGGHIALFEKLKQLIMDFPNTASKRGILIGVALGGLATGVKIILGIERPYMGGRS